MGAQEKTLSATQIAYLKEHPNYFQELGERWNAFIDVLTGDNGETRTHLRCGPGYPIVQIFGSQSERFRNRVINVLKTVGNTCLDLFDLFNEGGEPSRRFQKVIILSKAESPLPEKVQLAMQKFNDKLADVFSEEDIQKFWENPYDYSYATYGMGLRTSPTHLGRAYDLQSQYGGHGMYLLNYYGGNGIPTLLPYKFALEAISYVKHGMGTNERQEVELEQRKKDESQKIEREKREAAARAAEKNYYQMVLDSQKVVPPEITNEKVRNGIEFIINHRDMSQDELVKNLIAMGCNWLKPDVVQKFGQGEGEIKTGDTKFGANIIAQIFYGSETRKYVEYCFIDDCDETNPGLVYWLEINKDNEKKKK